MTERIPLRSGRSRDAVRFLVANSPLRDATREVVDDHGQLYLHADVLNGEAWRLWYFASSLCGYAHIYLDTLRSDLAPESQAACLHALAIALGLESEVAA